MFEAFSADDEVSIGNGHGDTENRNKHLMLSDRDVTTFE